MSGGGRSFPPPAMSIMARGPQFSTRFITLASVPLPIAIMTTSAAMPTMVPAIIKKVRTLFAASDCAPSLAMRSTLIRASSPLASDFSSSSASSGAETATSSAIRPSSMTMILSACSATSRSCVTMTMVRPWACRRWKMASTSAPLLESRLPVGSSARMIDGSLIRARAMATRCCWPPESWLGE